MDKFVESSFSVLTKDAIWSIMAKLKPEDVIKLCESGIVPVKYCEDESLYKFLINVHYKDYKNIVHDETYKEKFISLMDIIGEEECGYCGSKLYSEYIDYRCCNRCGDDYHVGDYLCGKHNHGYCDECENEGHY